MGKYGYIDNSSVPKKVNRHVMKALNLLSDGNIQQWIPLNTIVDQVQYQMRNLAPISNPISTIMRSLEILSIMGIIKRRDTGLYAIGHRYVKPLGTINSTKSVPPFEIISRRKFHESAVSIFMNCHDVFDFDPNWENFVCS